MRYFWHAGEWVPGWVIRAERAPHSLHIISDEMQPLQHPVSGQTVDSKSQFRAMTRAAGCVELGNDAPAVPAARNGGTQERRNDIERAWQKLEQGYRPERPQALDGEVRMYRR